jgi:hypothetical protein
MQCVDLALGAMGGRTVFAMHQGPTPWESVMAQVQKARQG